MAGSTGRRPRHDDHTPHWRACQPGQGARSATAPQAGGVCAVVRAAGLRFGVAVGQAGHDDPGHCPDGYEPVCICAVSPRQAPGRKRRPAHAGNGGQRTPENVLHTVELLGGWPGALLAQQVFRHKTRKVSFQVVFWLIVLVHQALWIDWLFLGKRLLQALPFLQTVPFLQAAPL
ncbi:putative family protein [Pseudomonas syringae pv. viburni]|uniref:Putative family protein n=1 Tax=Pseudomonas syringae pv. viburni TaxID=251703 RepID=A0A0Q0EZZ4_9PSED|nr:putative family protein [Pseudomonas syringae pv. viburni]